MVVSGALHLRFQLAILARSPVGFACAFEKSKSGVAGGTYAFSVAELKVRAARSAFLGCDSLLRCRQYCLFG